MQDAHFLAVKPLSVKTTRASCAHAVILNVMRHNARELQAEIGIGAESGIDPSRIHLNVTLYGPATADGVANAARDAMREHGIVAPRKNATLGIEIVVSLPAGLAIDYLAYFHDAMAWAQQHYRVPLLSAIIHNDEKNPHLHLVLLPVRDGKLVGSELLGDRTTVKAMQKGFHEEVAKQYGLRMPTAKKRYSAAERASGMALLRTTLQRNGSLTDHAIDALLVPHAKNPEPLLLALGLAMPAPPVKGSFVATMTKKVRSENPSRGFTKSPIGDLGTDTTPGLKAENEMSYALFRTSSSTPNISPQSAGIQATDDQHPADGLLTSQHTPAAAGPLRKAQAASEPSTTGQPVSTSARTTPANCKLTAANRQPSATVPAPGCRVETVSLAHLQTVSLAEQAGAGKLSDTPRGLQKNMDTPQSVHQLGTPAVDHHQGDANDTASQSAESSAHLDVSSSARISSPPTGQANATQYVGLVDHQAGACEPSYTPRPKLSAAASRIAGKSVPTIFVATSAPCANGMRPHKDVSKSGCISKGGGDALETQQVDQQAGQADAHRCYPAGGGHPSPQRGMVSEAADYQRQRDDEQPAETWCANLGEFVRSTGPPRGLCHL